MLIVQKRGGNLMVKRNYFKLNKTSQCSCIIYNIKLTWN